MIFFFNAFAAVAVAFVAVVVSAEVEEFLISI